MSTNLEWTRVDNKYSAIDGKYHLEITIPDGKKSIMFIYRVRMSPDGFSAATGGEHTLQSAKQSALRELVRFKNWLIRADTIKKTANS